MSVFAPWIDQDPRLDGWRPHTVYLRGLLREAEYRVQMRPYGHWWSLEEWWWCLPMVYGVGLPVLWCGAARQAIGARLWAAWLSWLGLAVAVALIVVPPLCYVCTHEGVRESHLEMGPWLALLGGVLIALPSMIELHRLRRRRARWAERPEALRSLSRDVPEHRGAPPGSLRDLVRAATLLWSELGPHRPIDTGQAGMLAELVRELRGLGPVEQTWLDERGARVEAVVQTLAPGSERESWFDEVLRLDRGLGRLVLASRAAPASCPYR